MDDQEEIANAAAYYIIVCSEFLKIYSSDNEDEARRPPKKRKYWMDTFYKSRKRYNATNMMHDLNVDPSRKFENFCRMSSVDFEKILSKIGPYISKNDTNMRKCIPIKERLAVTLRFLASGDSFKSLSYLFKISPQTVSRCVDDVCKALIQELKDEIKLPQNCEQWLKISEEFNDKWNFPNCLGAIDGKHIVIQCPNKSGTEYFNYKDTFSIVLMALVDANYNFIFVDVGCQGRISDGGVYRNTDLWTKFENDQLMLPADKPLPNETNILPFVFVVDSAFALNKHMMKPYSGVYNKGNEKRVFNYRLSRARRVVENAFGIMSSVFRVFRRPMLLDPEKVKNVTLTCALLHNYLRKSKTSSSNYCPQGTFDSEKEGEIIPGSWRQNYNYEASFLPIRRMARRSPSDAKEVRELFTEYFMTNGAVPWQNNF